jgi:RNA polymerase sigma-70 factor, ECF subfamily
VAPRSDELSDEVLMRRFQAGDRSAFTFLVRRHLSSIYNFIARHTSESVAEDLTQEVFLRVVQRARDFKHEAKLTTWMFSIARNLSIDHLRKMSLRKHPSLDDTGPSNSGVALRDRIADLHPSTSGERMAASGELGERIAAALQTLPPEQREVFLLREITHMPFQEIAEITGVPENTVKSRMRYALERLQSALKDYEEDVRSLG